MYILGRDTAIEMRIFLLILLHVLTDRPPKSDLWWER